MAVIGVGVEGHVGGEHHVGQSLLEACHGALEEAIGSVGKAGLGVLLLRRNDGIKVQGAHAQRIPLAGGLD